MRAIYAGFALAALQALTNNANAQADRARGEKLFGECVACHSLERGIQAVGPSLYGVLGRRAAALDEFRYSPAIKRSGITWNRETIDA